MGSWSEKTPEFVGARYDRLAPIYGVFEWLYALPLVRVRGKSIDALELNPGDAVLELGCGSGRNFALIEEKIGPRGALLGVDMSPRMLARAEKLARRRGWTNVHLTCGDAAASAPSNPVQGILFCFSYSTMRDRLLILESAWHLVDVGGRVVITDARLCPGWPQRVFSGLGAWMSNRTLLGKPDTDPEKDLTSVAGSVSAQCISFGPFGFEYVVCTATKRAAA